MKKTWCAAAIATGLMAVPSAARATGFHEIGEDYRLREKTELDLSGYLRTRGEALYNLDLDRGLDPTGQPLVYGNLFK